MSRQAGEVAGDCVTYLAPVQMGTLGQQGDGTDSNLSPTQQTAWRLRLGKEEVLRQLQRNTSYLERTPLI